ncbi:hypothetical protein DIE18_04460 [Burkholderia sp. Bp9125]|nr:hypothetical protein DIE18_04460 [Burkholderia sp. Bp9125]
MNMISSFAAIFSNLCRGRMHDDSLARTLLNDEALLNHVALSGMPGSGMRVLIEQMLGQQTVRGRGWVFIDTHGDYEMLDRLAAHAVDQGRSDAFYVLDFDRTGRSNTYDALRAGTPEDQALRVLQVLPDTENNPGGEFYAREAFALLAPLFRVLSATGRSVDPCGLADLLTRLQAEGCERALLDAIPCGPARTLLVAALAPYRKGNGMLDAAALKRTFGGLTGRLQLLGQPGRGLGAGYERVVANEQPEIDFSDILAHNKMCYVMLPVMCKDSTLVALARMVLHDITTSLHTRAMLPREWRAPFLCVMQDYPAYGPVRTGGFRAPLDSRSFSLARAMRVCMVPVVASGWDDLAGSMSESGFEDLVGNTFTKFYFRQKNSDIVAALHPQTSAAALDTLQAGEFVAFKGQVPVHGQLRPFIAAQAPAFVKRDMPTAVARPRLTIPAGEEESIG